MTASLPLGPVLRHVGPTTATVWVQASEAGRVRVVADGGVTGVAETFTVHGHHYAVCEITGLPSGAALPYEVFLNEARVWPEPGSTLPPSTLRTIDPDAPTRLLYGSCHTPTGDTPEGVVRYGPDMLRATARRLAREPVEGNLTLLLIGDQVYADEIQESMRAFLRAHRARTGEDGPEDEVVHYSEYAELYRQAWSDPQVRWLLSTVPTLMVFDDHDIRDDWNTSAAWRRSMDGHPWWRARVTSGLGAYWVYQHLGNLSPDERAADPLWALVRAARIDAGAEVDAFALRAHEEPGSYRWSHRHDVGGIRVLMLDTRCGRALGEGDPSDGSRSILGREGHAWLDEHLTGGPEHVVVVSTVPVVLPPAVHHLEAWNEAVCAGAWGGWPRRPAERLRQALDLEHWGAFRYSFERLADTLGRVARGERGPAPATILLLSGDVHFSYTAPVRHREVGEDGSRIVQLVSSPLCNRLPENFRGVVRLSASAPVHLVGRFMTWLARVPRPSLRWRLSSDLYFGNTIGEVSFAGRDVRARWYHVAEGGPDALPVVRTRVDL
ncbi:alkaline phosphatase D family protein [Nocardiopsis lambiniae]|uniref:Alkaline phosphatase D family protein n=1 Tax=Nocardiopsis lambiniae TaxID=3075539 RepID=A0ABU2MCW6_9ACTN|nr:alkaline phosphatase D family protein [Nocardiopsis sp. DSM 44743]MDT0330415.1 alkaline phosphatase D family protein [Nocardiopsis sp. DSM 44743]